MEVKVKEVKEMSPEQSTPKDYCLNLEDPIFFDDFDFVNNDVVLIFKYEEKNSRSSKAQAECYNRDTLLHLVDEVDEQAKKDRSMSMRIWKMSDGQPKNDPEGELLMKLPLHSTWVRNFQILRNTDYKVYHLTNPVEVPIGSRFGVSQLHGVIYKVYTLKEGPPNEKIGRNLQEYFSSENISREKMKQSEKQLSLLTLEQDKTNYQQKLFKMLTDPEYQNYLAQIEKKLDQNDLASADKLLSQAEELEQRQLSANLMMYAIDHKRQDLFEHFIQFNFEPYYVYLYLAKINNADLLQRLCQVVKQRGLKIRGETNIFESAEFQNEVMRQLLLTVQGNIRSFVEAWINCGGNPNLVLNNAVKLFSEMNINLKDELSRQSITGFINMFRWLIREKGAIPNILVAQGNFGYIKYILFNIEKTNEELLEGGPLMAKYDKRLDEFKALFESFKAEQDEEDQLEIRDNIINFLIDNMAILSNILTDSNLPPNDMYTILAMACETTIDKIVKIVLDKVGRLDGYADTLELFRLAADYADIYKLLLDQGAKLGNGYAISQILYRAIKKKMSVDLIYQMLQTVDIGLRPAMTGDVFIWACQEGYIELVKFLVEQGVDVHVYGNNALIKSAESGHLEVVKYLVEKGANIHTNNDEPLRLAQENRHPKVVEYIQSLGSLNS